MLLAITTAWSLGLLQGRESEQRQQTAASYRQAAKADAERTCVDTDPRAVFECVYVKTEAAYEQEYAEQDLSAQQRAASAALVSAGVAFLALIATVFGVWFVKRTLEATLKAVEDTGRATNEMAKSNEIAERTAQVTLAAHRDQIAASRPLMKLVIEGTKFEIAPFGDMWDDPMHGLQKAIRPFGEVKNVGSQPCWIESVWIGIYVGIPTDGIVPWPTVIPDQFMHVHAGFVDKGDSVKFGGGFWRIPEYQFDRLGIGAAICYGMCQYRSLARHLFTSRFAYHLNRGGNVLTPGMPLDIPAHWRDGRVERAKRAEGDPIEWID